eukprot:5220386-Prymnesium_polylepis.1
MEAQRLRSFFGDCNDKKRCLGYVIGTPAFVLTVVLICISYHTVSVTEFGIVKTLSGGVHPHQVFPGGRHMIGVGNSFISFPASRKSLSFGDNIHSTYDTRPRIQARTGPDEGDNDGGGQPVWLSVSFQYQLSKDQIPEVYMCDPSACKTITL